MALQLKAEEIKQLVLDDDLWQRANIVIKMGKLICDVLDLSNSDGSTAGKIYEKCFQVRVDMIRFQLAFLMQFYLSNSPLKKGSSLVRSTAGQAWRVRHRQESSPKARLAASPEGFAEDALRERGFFL